MKSACTCLGPFPNPPTKRKQNIKNYASKWSKPNIRNQSIISWNPLHPSQNSFFLCYFAMSKLQNPPLHSSRSLFYPCSLQYLILCSSLSNSPCGFIVLNTLLSNLIFLFLLNVLVHTAPQGPQFFFSFLFLVFSYHDLPIHFL